ncbi:MAG: insulinase family protein [Anaerolineales bacterium]|nr:insulinase family protein [Anaerolineales bacterium]
MAEPANNLSVFPGPEDVLRRELPNGIVVLARANLFSPSVAVSGYLPAGSIFDRDEKLGTADFTASCLKRGTRTRSFQQIHQQLESIGAGLGFSGGTHSAEFTGRSLAEDLPMLLSLLADTLRFPVFPARQVERHRASVLTSLDFQWQDSQDRAGMAFDELVYPAHPYGRPDEGYRDTVKRIRRRDLLQFHRKHYGPKGMVISIIGGIDPEKAVSLVEAALGEWRNPQQAAPPDLPEWQPLRQREDRRIPMEGKSQADLVIGTAGPPRSSDDFIPAAVGNQILGNFGMMGRLGEKLREEAGLAYYVYSGLGTSVGPGAWFAAAGVAPKDVDQAIEIILSEIQRFVTEPVSFEELADVQANLIGSQPLHLESNLGVASLLLHLERHQLGLDYMQGYADLINSVTPEMILSSASHYLQVDRLAVVAAGRLEQDSPREEGGGD